VKFSIDGLHKAFENRAKLGIMSALVVNQALEFTTLKDYFDLTDGNLASHLKALEKEGFVGVEKSFIGRKPNTKYTITSVGKKAFEAHLKALELLIHTHK